MGTVGEGAVLGAPAPVFAADPLMSANKHKQKHKEDKRGNVVDPVIHNAGTAGGGGGSGS